MDYGCRYEPNELSAAEMTPKMLLSGDQARRALDLLAETKQLLQTYLVQRAFDSKQEQERQEHIEFCKSHISKLRAMLWGAA